MHGRCRDVSDGAVMSLGVYIPICHTCVDAAKNCRGPCLCPSDGVDIIAHARNRECPLGKYDAAPRGLGDVVEDVLKVAGFKSCGPCKDRREALNSLGEKAKKLLQ